MVSVTTIITNNNLIPNKSGPRPQILFPNIKNLLPLKKHTDYRLCKINFVLLKSLYQVVVFINYLININILMSWEG